MKIEKLSENQIRCTLNKSDLASRQLKISELAYGSEKAKELFRDMMQQASYELGFETDDIPLMIEAIPVSSDCIILIVTKVDDPEELDTRFSKFSPDDTDDFDIEDDYSFNDDLDTLESISSSPDNGLEDISDNVIDSTDNMSGLFNKIKDYLNNSLSDTDSKAQTGSSITSSSKDDNFIPLHESLQNALKNKTASPSQNVVSSENNRIIRVFIFNNLDVFTEAAHNTVSIFNGLSRLYKSDDNKKYYLVIEKNSCPAVNFNKTCNILSEYADKDLSSEYRYNFFEEHYECIIKEHAIQIMSKL